MSDNNNTSSGMAFGSLLFLLFLGLKLTHYIDWSWWWITAPLWGPIAIALVILILVLIFAGSSGFYKSLKQFKKSKKLSENRKKFRNK